MHKRFIIWREQCTGEDVDDSDSYISKDSLRTITIVIIIKMRYIFFY